MAVQNDSTLLCKGDLKAYHESIAPYLGGNLMVSTNVSDYYSEDEKIVGVWTNGKPIYQITKKFTNPSVSWNEISFGFKADTVWLVNVFAKTSDGWSSGCSWYNTDSNRGSFYVHKSSDNTVSLWIKNSYTVTEAWVTIQYTKITDAANSAAVIPGCYDINRPNLWPANKEIFFGNGLYGQRITGTESLTANVRKDIRINNEECQLKAFGGWVKPDGGTWMINFPYYWNNENYISTAQIYSNIATSPYAGLMLFFKSNQTQTTIYDIWVTYTK